VIKTSTSKMTIDGTISANGGTGSPAGSSGGAGGSILIQTYYLDGLGSITANGGSATLGDIYGGGGSGGRIAIHYNFTGGVILDHVLAVGGLASEYNSGGPGTVFKKNRVSDIRKLEVDNGNCSIVTNLVSMPIMTRGSVAWLADLETTNYTFSEISIRNGSLAIHSTQISFI